VAALLLGLLVVPVSSARACSCALVLTADSVANADVVLRGTIITKDDPGGGSSGRTVTYAVSVDRVYKGAAARTTYIRSAAEGGSCGIEVGIGMTYLLFARQQDDDLVSGLCDGTTPASQKATAELVALTGAGSEPVPAIPPAADPAPQALPGSTQPPAPAGPPWPGIGIGGAIVAGLLWLGWRGRAAAAERHTQANGRSPK
jgi:hypothetical protein